jgi:hypothetical protein
MCGTLLCNYSPLCTTKCRCAQKLNGLKFDLETQRETYLPTHNFWAWFSYTQRKKLQRPSNVNLKDLSNVLQCNFNLAKQVTCEKKLENLEVNVVFRWEGSLGGKCTTIVNDNGSNGGS